MQPIITGLISLLGSIFGGIFGLKKEQAETLNKALDSLTTISDSDKAYFAAVATAIDAVYTKGSWIERTWRPVLMWVCTGLIVSRWFGWAPPGLDATEINHMYTFVYVGLGGYIPLRSVDKWMQGFQIGNLLKKFIEKKIV